MFDKDLIKNSIQKIKYFQTFFQINQFKIKGYKMKLSTMTLATILALAFTGCTLDSALNSVTSTIDSITTPSGTTNASTNSKAEAKSFKTAKELEHFCNTALVGVRYQATSLPPLKWGFLAGIEDAELNVINSNMKIILEPRNHFRYDNPFFGPQYDPRNPNQIIKLKKPVLIEKITANGYSCRIEYY